MAKVKWALKTDIGRTRKANQDSLAVLDQEELADRAGALFVLADGMGGGPVAKLPAGLRWMPRPNLCVGSWRSKQVS